MGYDGSTSNPLHTRGTPPRGGHSRGRPGRGGPRGRARGTPRTGRGGGVRDSNNTESEVVQSSEVPPGGVQTGGFEDLKDDGWGGELPNDGWGSELSDVKIADSASNQTETSGSSNPTVIDIWDFTSAPTTAAAPTTVQQPPPTDVSC